MDEMKKKNIKDYTAWDLNPVALSLKQSGIFQKNSSVLRVGD